LKLGRRMVGLGSCFPALDHPTTMDPVGGTPDGGARMGHSFSCRIDRSQTWRGRLSPAGPKHLQWVLTSIHEENDAAVRRSDPPDELH
jgi:hypothetical protein